MSLPIVSTTDSFEKMNLDLNFTYSMLGRRKEKKTKFHRHLLVQTHNKTALIKVIRPLVLQKREKREERETDGHNLLYILSLCVALLEVTRYLLENQIGILCFLNEVRCAVSELVRCT
jgi:hypothetical protein